MGWGGIRLGRGRVGVVGAAPHGGVLEYGGVRAARSARGRPFRVMVLLVLITAVASAALDNVTTVLLVAPVTLLVCARLGVPPVPFLVAEVRSSIDYSLNQPGSAQLRRVVVTGGSAQLPGLPERLSALVGVPVEPAYMHDLLRIGDIGFAPDELPRLEPYLPAPGHAAPPLGAVAGQSPCAGRWHRRE